MRKTGSISLLVGLLSCSSFAGCGGSKSEPLPPPAAAPVQPEIDRVTLLREAQARLKAEREKKREGLRAVGTATVTEKKLVGKKPDQKLELEFKFTNKGDKALTQAEGAIVISDASGTSLRSLKVPFNEEIAAGKSATKRGKFPIDPGKEADVALVKTKLGELKVEWNPQLYRFPDGTQLVAE